MIPIMEQEFVDKNKWMDKQEFMDIMVVAQTTPGPWLFDEIRKRSDIRIHTLIRPRFGDFCYTDAEFSMVKHAVEDFRKMGAEGVVFGVLKPDGTLNMEQMKELMEAAGDMSVTLHRAFDVCVDPIETMEQAISLGINTILTSGQRNVCLQGADLLKELVEKSQGRITIQAGSGVGAEVIRQLYPLTGVRAYHMTGKRVIDSEMQFRKDGVNMGLPMLSEYEIWRTDVDNIRAAKKVLEQIPDHQKKIITADYFNTMNDTLNAIQKYTLNWYTIFYKSYSKTFKCNI